MGQDDPQPTTCLPCGVYAVVIRETCGAVTRLHNALEPRHLVARAVALAEAALSSD
jgi:hypothetical protein